MNELTVEQLCEIDGIGEVLAQSFVDYFGKEENQQIVTELEKILRIQYPEPTGEQPLEGKTFVITGSLARFENRRQCKEQIEALGGRVAGSVSAKTDYLVNNDITSQSSKNKKAKELGIPIITEEDLLSILNAGQ